MSGHVYRVSARPAALRIFADVEKVTNMEMTITTPSLLFPAISLLLLAYTNRFVVLANVIRQLSAMESAHCEEIILRQIDSLRSRLSIIRLMQVFGVLSFVMCTLAILFLFIGQTGVGQILFGCSLILLVISLLFSLYEVQISTRAINIEIERLEQRRQAMARQQ